MDHIAQLADGGMHEPSNLQMLYRAFHWAKTAREAVEQARRRRAA
jgi:hypothetical protein